MMIYAALFFVAVIAFSILWGSRAQARQPQDVRAAVQELCQKGNVNSAFSLALKSWSDAREKYGDTDLKTAYCITALAEAAFYRREFLVAELFYQKALSIQEQALGPSDPQVVRTMQDLEQVRAEHRW